jgi:hypothetical protein
MYLVGHWHTKALVWGIVAVVATVVLKFTWYDYLPKADATSPTMEEQPAKT